MTPVRRLSLHLLATLLLAPALQAQVPNTLLHSIPPPLTGLQDGAELGASVAVEGDYTVTGAPFDDASGGDSGVVKVFHTSTGALLFVLPNPNPAGNDRFGTSVAISGTRVVVGAPFDDVGADDAGSAYVYDLTSDTPTVPTVTLNNPSPATFDLFGTSVAISGTRIVVGAYFKDSVAGNSGSAYGYDLTSATPRVPVVTWNNPTPALQDNFGYAVAISGTRVVVGAHNDDTGGYNDGIAYVYDFMSATPAVPVATLNNPSPSFQDNFGYSVGISGTRVIVGAYRDDSGELEAGSAYVYDLISGTPTVPIATLNNPSPGFQDNFGYSVAISGARVVIGARYDDTGADDAGSSYVYDLNSATPTVPVATLLNPSPMAGDHFGNSVAISGTRVVIGANDDDTGAEDAGSAYVYDLATWHPTIPTATLNHPGLELGNLFGYAVAISGTRVVVGALADNTGGINAGSAYVYDLSGATPTVPTLTLHNPTPAFQDNFGTSVAISGTLVVIGAPRDDAGAQDAGSAYIYDLTGATPSIPSATLNNPGLAANDLFGSCVAISGSRVVVGALYNDTGATYAGSAYVYDLTSSTPTIPTTTLNNPSPSVDEHFGTSVAISGTQVVVGAPYDHNGATGSGSAYVYDLTSATPAVPTATLNNPSLAAYDAFGNSVAISGTRVVVGTPFDDTGAKDAGSTYVYDLTSATPTVPVVTLNNPSPAANDRFGCCVAISGTRVVVGAYQDDAGATDAGSAYVYDLTSATPTIPVTTLNKSHPAASDQFGISVAISDTTIAIGTPGDDTLGSEKGYAYIYGPNPDLDGDGLRDAWELSYWPTTTGHSALDDFDHDGYVEVLELALGLDPTVPDPGGLPPVTNEGDYLTMTITKHAGVTYEVQSAGTLLPGQPDSFSPATTTILLNNATTLKVRDNTLIGTTPTRFLRVKVTTAP